MKELQLSVRNSHHRYKADLAEMKEANEKHGIEKKKELKRQAEQNELEEEHNY